MIALFSNLSYLSIREYILAVNIIKLSQSNAKLGDKIIHKGLECLPYTV